MTASVLLSIFGSVAMVFALVFSLGVTLAFEIPVAALFRVGSRGLSAVILANVVTNPVAVFLAYVVVFSGVGPGWAQWTLGALIEAAVVLVEWRLLVWALGETVGSARRVLLLSLTINVASIAGPALVGSAIFWINYLFPT